MSVNIISTLPKLTQAAAVENAAVSDSAAIGQDFASLLLGQLTPIAPEGLPEISVKAELPLADAKATDASPTDASSTDATALFAALGLVPLEAARTIETSPPEIEKSAKTTVDVLAPLQTTEVVGQNPGKQDKITSEPMKVMQTTATVGQNLDLKGQVEALITEPAPTGIPAADEKPAKFAVTPFVASSNESVINKNDSSAPVAKAIAEFASTPPMPNITQNLPVNHETSYSVPTSIREQSWAGDFAQKIVWLAANDKQAAQITLNPPQMGPIEISLNMDKSSATASFVSANAEVRDAIETALPRLREMFASAGIELGQTNVSAESFRQQTSNGDGNRRSSQWLTDNAILVSESAVSLSGRAFSAQRGNGMVDIFA